MKKAVLKNDEINLLIISYLTDSISEGDMENLNEWINADKENRIYFNELKDSWILSGKKSSDSSTLTQKSWNEFRNKLKDSGKRESQSISGGEKISLAKYIKMAASWLLIFGIGSLFTLLITGRQKEKQELALNKTVEISTPLGARSMIRMSDSSQVWLNAGTTISYSQDYGQMNRTINLNGEAYFKVAKDSLHPFIVNTQGIVIRALGTRFNVKAYPEEKTISATLEEGKIDIKVPGLTDKNDRVLLKPNDKLIYQKETDGTIKYIESAEERVIPDGEITIKPREIHILTNVRTELYTSWKDPRWIIYREPLSTLVPMLERRFNMVIIFDNEQLKKYKFTGTIENETVDQIMNALRMTAPLDYQINKDTLRLTLNQNSNEEFKRIMKK